MKNDISNKILRMKMKADLFLKENKKVYIKDINNQYFFADILFVGDNTLEVSCFAPLEKKDKHYNIYWIDIILFEEYKSKMEMKL